MIPEMHGNTGNCSSPRMLRHIRDFYALSTGKLKLNQARTKTNNRENDSKVANSTYILRIYEREIWIKLITPFLSFCH